jgi:hypothetical protein
MHLHQPVVERLDGLQLQPSETGTPGNQWNAVADEDGHHTDDELVDRVRVEE